MKHHNSGKTPWNKGLTKYTDKRMAAISDGFKERWKDLSYRIPQIVAITKGSQGKSRLEKNPAWLGGKSYEKYGFHFNEELKDSVRKRDDYCCQQCSKHQDELYYNSGEKYKLIIHHIDYDKKNSDLTNLISLCHGCHLDTNFHREDWTGYFHNMREAINA